MSKHSFICSTNIFHVLKIHQAPFWALDIQRGMIQIYPSPYKEYNLGDKRDKWNAREVKADTYYLFGFPKREFSVMVPEQELNK